ncbi:MAG TPA: hypothetical protein VKI44_41165 [Acetobacteraceae bacterium]|nr:hypothetical protein [Acetobacteraceae bacterium]
MPAAEKFVRAYTTDRAAPLPNNRPAADSEPLPPPRLADEARLAFGPGPTEQGGSHTAGIVLTPEQVTQALSKTQEMRHRLFPNLAEEAEQVRDAAAG